MLPIPVVGIAGLRFDIHAIAIAVIALDGITRGVPVLRYGNRAAGLFAHWQFDHPEPAITVMSPNARDADAVHRILQAQPRPISYGIEWIKVPKQSIFVVVLRRGRRFLGTAAPGRCQAERA